MGFIKGTFAFLIGLSLFISLFLLNFSFTVSKSLEYENVKVEVTEVVLDTINEIGKTSFVSEICPKGISPCEFVFNNSEDIEFFVEDAVYFVYYKDYVCDGLDCFSDNPLSIISEKSMNYWNSNFYFFFGISFFLFILFFLLLSNKENSLIYLAIFIVLTSIPLFALSGFFSYLFGSFLKFMGFTGDTNIPSEILTRLSLIPFSQAGSVFWIMFTIAFIIALIGFGVKSFKFGNFVGRIIPHKTNK